MQSKKKKNVEMEKMIFLFFSLKINMLHLDVFCARSKMIE